MSVTVRRAQADDVDYLVELLNHDDVQPFLAAIRPRDAAGLAALVERSERDPDAFGLFVIEVDGERAGTVDFELANRRSSIANVGGLAIHPAFRGRRIGDEAAQLVQRHLILDLGIHRLQLEIYGFNDRALAHAERAGWIREGVKRRAYRHRDGWVDGVVFGLTREDLEPASVGVGSIGPMRHLSRFQRWYGSDEAPVERQPVRAGPLTAELEGPDLRYVRVGGVEVVRRLYAAVRDQNWGTVPPQLSNVELEVGDDRFSLRFDARCADDALGIDVAWKGELVGEPDGALTCSFDGVATSACRYNRIGWCVLHPAENAGRPFRAKTPAGVLEDRLPSMIGPQLIVDGLPAPLFPSFDELEIEVAEGVWARFAFDGDLFETEDQRNWTDASFKTYSTPLSLGFPHQADAGRRFRQSVRLTVSGAQAQADDEAGRPVRIELGARGETLPAIGLGASSHGQALSPREAELLRALGPDHVRADVDLADESWSDALARGVSEAQAAGVALELAVSVANDDGPLAQLVQALRSSDVLPVRVLAFRKGEPTSTQATVERVRNAFRNESVPIYGGTNILFTDLNRFRPEPTTVDGVAWPLNATVHAADDTSVSETAAMHGETVRSARAFCGDLPLAVSPVTFNQRFNPVATGPEPEPGPGQLPSQVDRRQPSLLGAGWTVASVKSLAEAGATSVTYFETTGWRGVMETENGPARPERFASWAGMVFPMYHVFADLGEWKGAELVATRSSAPLSVEALAVRTPEGLHLLVANLTSSEQQCRIDGLPAGGVSIRRLDENSFANAGSDPETFRTSFETAPADGSLELALLPFAVARLDLRA